MTTDLKNENNTDVCVKVKKTADKKAYMREYMRKYNLTRFKRRTKLTDEQRKINNKISHKKYYDKNREIIRKKSKVKALQKRIRICQNKLISLE